MRINTNTVDSTVPLKLEKFEVKKLFGCLDHTIPFQKEGMTFIHGPNGCGKTTVLRLLHGFLSLNLNSIKNIDFSSAKIYFDKSNSVEIIRKVKIIKFESNSNTSFIEEDEEDITEISFDLIQHGFQTEITRSEYLFGSDEQEQLSQAIRRNPAIVSKYLPQLIQIGTRAWREKDSGKTFSIATIVGRFGEAFPYSIPVWFRERMRRVPLGLIKTQRLLEIPTLTPESMFDSDEPVFHEVVNLYADELRRLITETIEASALSSQGKERSFPQRILAKQYESIKDAELRKLYLKLQKRLTDLAAVGLQESTTDVTLPVKTLNPTERRILSLYLSDLNEKLDTFSELQGKIELLKSLFSQKLRRKTFQITRSDGFLITDSRNESKLKPADLSSGEQHQLVMLYQLIFSTVRGQLFLIDEPEISLHIEWQRQFSEDLIKVAELCGHSFLIATHSPQIINSRIDLAIALDGGIVE